jgi:hypothetical protein
MRHRSCIQLQNRCVSPSHVLQSRMTRRHHDPRIDVAPRLQVLIDGKPAPGIQVSRNELHESAPRMDAQGIALFTPKRGWNHVWAGQRTAVTGEADFNERSVEVLLVFEARR